jgi:hypothetical protein
MRLIASFIACVLTAVASVASAEEALVGSWKVASFYTEDNKTHQRTNMYGEHPVGGVIFTPAGRYFAIATAGVGKPATTAEDQAAAFRSMIAYTGWWRADGDSFVVRVDVAWNPTWVGTEQVRFWKMSDGKLNIVSAPIANPSAPGETFTATLVLERE